MHRGDNRSRSHYRRDALLIVAIAVSALLAGFVRTPSGEDRRRVQLVPPPTLVWQQIFSRPSDIPSPDDNPITPAKVALGKALFSDKRLSGDGDRSCATCHDPARGFSDGNARPMGRSGRPLRRNALSLWNLAWATSFYWDGRVQTLEAQARVPIEHPDEMGGNLDEIAVRLTQDPSMREQFRAAFPATAAITPQTILAAVASYERSLVSPLTRFDRWIRGDSTALTLKEYRGFALFAGRAGCLSCHGGWRFTDNRFHDIGLRTADRGRGGLGNTTAASPAPLFKTPGLRQLTESAPYMHDGSLKTLEDVIAHYSGNLERRPSLAANIVKDLRLDRQQRGELVAFLKTLSAD